MIQFGSSWFLPSWWGRGSRSLWKLSWILQSIPPVLAMILWDANPYTEVLSVWHTKNGIHFLNWTLNDSVCLPYSVESSECAKIMSCSSVYPSCPKERLLENEPLKEVGGATNLNLRGAWLSAGRGKVIYLCSPNEVWGQSCYQNNQ